MYMWLIGVFVLMVFVFVVMVVIFVGLMINIGFEGWFLDCVSCVVGNLVFVVYVYEVEYICDLEIDVFIVVDFFNIVKCLFGMFFIRGDLC